MTVSGDGAHTSTHTRMHAHQTNAISHNTTSSMAPAQHRALSPSLPLDAPPQRAAKCARMHHEASVAACPSNLPTANKTVGPHAAKQLPGHHDERPTGTNAGVSESSQPPSSPSSPLRKAAGCSPTATVTSPRTQRSLMLLERETHNIQLKLGQKEMEGKGTAKCYPCQVQNYRVWFEQEQSQIAASDPSQVVLPVFPVTAAKVAAFLHRESTCEKVCLACLAVLSALALT